MVSHKITHLSWSTLGNSRLPILKFLFGKWSFLVRRLVGITWWLWNIVLLVESFAWTSYILHQVRFRRLSRCNVSMLRWSLFDHFIAKSNFNLIEIRISLAFIDYSILFFTTTIDLHVLCLLALVMTESSQSSFSLPELCFNCCTITSLINV